MPPEGDPTVTDDQDPIDDAAGAADPTPAVDLTPDAIKRSPEYQALLKANRSLARANGTLTGQVGTARTQAEEARLAAEATKQAALDAEITAALGEDGVTFWSEFAELAQTDPVAAAKRLAEFRASGVAAQSAAADADPAAGDPDAGEGGTVPAQTPPPSSRGVDGGASLTQPAGETPDQIVAGLTKTFQDTVERVQDPTTRNRVTMKDRAAGFIAFLGASYVQATGNEPADRRRG